MKKENGITLIALIITIIIMLILVAVTISILINSGLIGKAKEGAQDTKSAYEQEQRLGESITIDGVEYNSIDEYIGSTDESNEVKDILVCDYGEAYITMENGNLYKATYSEPGGMHYFNYFNMNDINIEDTPMLTNVKKFYNGAYISKTNELYFYNYDTDAYEKFTDNVKEYDGYYYLTLYNELYVTDYTYNEYDQEIMISEKKADNVTHIYDGMYLTTSNKLYRIYHDYSQNEYVIDEIAAENVKEFSPGAYITNANELYVLNYDYNQSIYVPEKIADNVKSGTREHYITTTNELYEFRQDVFTKVADNVKEAWDDLSTTAIYLTTSNELHVNYMDYTLHTYVDELKATNVIDYYKPYNKPSGLWELGLRWYKVSNGDIYLLDIGNAN